MATKVKVEDPVGRLKALCLLKEERTFLRNLPPPTMIRILDVGEVFSVTNGVNASCVVRAVMDLRLAPRHIDLAFKMNPAQATLVASHAMNDADVFDRVEHLAVTIDDFRQRLVDVHDATGADVKQGDVVMFDSTGGPLMRLAKVIRIYYVDDTHSTLKLETRQGASFRVSARKVTVLSKHNLLQCCEHIWSLPNFAGFDGEGDEARRFLEDTFQMVKWFPMSGKKQGFLEGLYDKANVELLGGGGKRPRKTVRDLAKDDAKLLCAIRSDEKATPEWARELLPSGKKKQKHMSVHA